MFLIFIIAISLLDVFSAGAQGLKSSSCLFFKQKNCSTPEQRSLSVIAVSFNDSLRRVMIAHPVPNL